jgi:CRISPR system Cascade subunit CasA
MSFNLLQDHWVPVVDQDWNYQEVSLVDLFTDWHNYREIQADNPPTTLAIYRFLLAILHRAYQGPMNVDHWEEIRDDNGQGAIAYLEKWRDRFYLFHPECPFMQDAEIPEESSGDVYLAHVLHGNNTSTVFCHEHEWSHSSLSIPEAARLILRLQNFDTGGRKTGATESAAVLPMMDAANILVRGHDLCETLLLNLIQYDGEEKPCVATGDDLPCWERQYQKPKERIPVGYIDYLTYQWRRVKIFAQGDRVVRLALHPGDRVSKDLSTSQWECGIAYTKTKKGLMTVRLNQSRSLWRDSAVFLQSSNEVSSCPRIVEWVAILKAEDDLVSSPIHLQVLGLNVDNAKPLGWTSQQFAAPLIYLTNKALWQSLSSALAIAEDHQQIFRAFRGSPYYSLAEVLKNNDAAGFASTLDGESPYWAKLDRAFQELLQALPLDKNQDGNGITYGTVELTKWTKTVQDAARDSFTDSIASIRNYEARAKALRALQWKLADLRLTPLEKEERKSKAKNRKKEKASA